MSRRRIGIVRFSRLMAAVGGLACVGAGAIEAVGRPVVQFVRPAPIFKAGVDLVSIAAVVRDGRGRVVRGLDRHDFTVLDQGQSKDIIEFRHDGEVGVSLAILIDGSGSMGLASKLDVARATASRLVSLLDERDEVALFSFDTELRELRSFGAVGSSVSGQLERIDAFGSTSLYDAIAATARQVADRPDRRAAVVVLTDGVDTASRLSAAEVSGLANEIAVPVYVVVSASPLDDPDADVSLGGDGLRPGDLEDLSRWTGGGLFVLSRGRSPDPAVRGLLAEMRHRYVMAFEASGPIGWHPIEVRVRDRRFSVRARGGYMAGVMPGAQ